MTMRDIHPSVLCRAKRLLVVHNFKPSGGFEVSRRYSSIYHGVIISQAYIYSILTAGLFLACESSIELDGDMYK